MLSVAQIHDFTKQFKRDLEISNEADVVGSAEAGPVGAHEARVRVRDVPFGAERVLAIHLLLPLGAQQVERQWCHVRETLRADQN